MSKGDIERSIEAIFGNGSSKEIDDATTKEKIIERIEMSKREVQFEEWERMRREKKQLQRQDRRLNVFWRKNKTFPAQVCGEDETPGAEETLEFWKSVNNKEVSAGWKEDRSIREVLYETGKWTERGRQCRCFEFSETEFEEVLRCTAPWKGVPNNFAKSQFSDVLF